MNIQARVILGWILFGLCVPTSALEPTRAGIDLHTWNLGPGNSIPGDTNQFNIFENSVESWWNQPWGTRSTFNLTDLNAESRYETHPVNFKQRLLFTPKNTVVDAGVGIQTIGFGRNDSRDGFRLSLGARMGLGRSITLYGESAWMPGLIESSGFDGLSGLEFETGVMLNPLPYLSIRAAYRRLDLDYTLTGSTGEHSFSEGIIFGTGIHW